MTLEIWPLKIILYENYWKVILIIYEIWPCKWILKYDPFEIWLKFWCWNLTPEKYLFWKTLELIERSNNILSKVHINQNLDGDVFSKSDNIYELRKEIEQNSVWYMTRQLSSEENLKILVENRRKMGVPLIPIHDGTVTKKEYVLKESEKKTKKNFFFDFCFFFEFHRPSNVPKESWKIIV